MSAVKKIDARYMFKGVVDRPCPLPFDQCIELSSRLSKLPIIGREQSWEVIRMAPEDIVPLLHAQKIDFMLVGAHGIAGWLFQPRATHDVDILIRGKDKGKASQLILKKYTDLILEKCPEVWRFSKAGQQLLDLMLATSPFHKRVFKENDFTKVDGIKVKVPKVECALAMKFTAMTGHYRPLPKKYQDVADFQSVVEKNKKLDMTLLHQLGERRYPGGGKELLGYVEDARAGRRMEI